MSHQKQLNDDQARAQAQAIQGFLYPKKVMAEEVLHKNPGARILPSQPVPDDLPTCFEMIAIKHKICGAVAFYYTHVPGKGEMMTASRARTIGGDTIEPSSPMICGSCGDGVESSELQVSKIDYEKAHGKNK